MAGPKRPDGIMARRLVEALSETRWQIASEIASEAYISPPTAMRYLRALYVLGWVQKRKLRHGVQWRAARCSRFVV